MLIILKLLLEFKWVWLLAFLLIFTAISPPVWPDIADSILSSGGKRWALLVGIADYPSSGGIEVEKLKSPVKDAKALAEFLKSSERGGFDPQYVFTLTDAQATRREVLIKFNEIKDRALPEDMVIFYFSGHGVRHGESNTTYLVPYDYDLRDIDATCIDFDDLAQKIRRMQANKVVVILDACHSGGVKIEGARSAPDRNLVDRYLQAFKTSEGRALLLSSDQSEVSWETEDSGVFTKFLLEALDGKADADDDGIVTFTEAANYVENEVPKYTREHFPRVQKPARRYDLGQVRGDIPLAIDWRKVSVKNQQKILEDRSRAIFQAHLDDELEEFSLRVAKTAYDAAIKGEEPTDEHAKLLDQIDKLRNGTIGSESYAVRAKAIQNLTLKHLTVKVVPADASIVLTPKDAPNRELPSTAPNVYAVKEGKYRVSASREGYETCSLDVTMGKEGKTVNVEMKKLMGTLKLRVEPDDAQVTITPLSVAVPDNFQSRGMRVRQGEDRQLPVGTYQVTVNKPGYEPVTAQVVEVKPNATVPVVLKLTPISKPSVMTASIAASNMPSDAKFYINGAPAQLPYDAPPGTYKLRFERRGYEPIEMSKTLKAGAVMPVSLNWKVITGKLRIRTEPRGAAVKIVPISLSAPDTDFTESNEYSILAESLNELPVGTYRVSVQKDGYETVIKDAVEVKANDVIQITLTLRVIGAPDSGLRQTPSVSPVQRGLPRTSAFAASLLVPGLGHHLQGQRTRGLAFEAATIGVGGAALWALFHYNGALDDYKTAKTQLAAEAPKNTAITDDLYALQVKQKDTYDDAKRARNIAIATQFALGIVWVANAVDAGMMPPGVPSEAGGGLAVEPNRDGFLIVARASF